MTQGETMTDQTTNEQPKQRRRWLWPVLAALAFVFGIIIGAAGGDEQPEEASPQVEETESPELQQQVAALEEQLATAQAKIEEQEAALAEAQAAEPAPEEPAEPQSEDGTYTVGQYEFADVQVGEDFAGDFEARARVTNTGDTREVVAWTMTVFQEGTVVGTLMGTASSLESGATVTVNFIGTDAHTDWDEVEFQTDMEL